MKTMMLWLMVQHGVWDVYTDVYKNAVECEKAHAVLLKAMPKIDLSNHPKKRAHIRSLYMNGSSGGAGMMFTECY